VVYICPKGYIPLGDFYKILPGGGKFHRSNFKKLWPCSTKTRQKFASGEKFWGSIRKLEHRCTTTNLPLCNDTIIVLKIILLHIISIITNFVIPKRDKQTDRQKKHHTFSSTAGARPTIPTILGMVIEEVRPIFAPLTFLIRSVVLLLWAIENLWENVPTGGKCL